MRDYYSILEVQENATSDEIKRSYRQLSLKFHPDRNVNNPDACGKFQKISEAYETLGDVDKRKEYDMSKSNPFMKMMSGVSGNGINPIDELFSQLFSQGGMSQGGMSFPPGVQMFRNGVQVNMQHGGGLQKPVPIIKTINIKLETVLTGVNQPVEIERWIVENGNKVFEKETMYIDIPKGIDDGEIIIIRDKGNILNDNIKGDIKLFLKIDNNTEFKRGGLDLFLNKTITLKEALCGFTFELNYLNGKSYTINNNAGNIVPSGFRKIIPNMGFERDARVGNLIIIFDVTFPISLSVEVLEALKKIDF
jgi:DnaJ-class molecular chaperone